MSESAPYADPVDDELHDVYVCYSGLEARRITGILEQEGIESLIRDRSVSDFPTPNNLESRQIIAAYPGQEDAARNIILQAIRDEMISKDGHII